MESEITIKLFFKDCSYFLMIVVVRGEVFCYENGWDVFSFVGMLGSVIYQWFEKCFELME